MRRALDDGRPRDALTALNRELGVDSDQALPSRPRPDDAVLVLDRASVQQAVGQYEYSKRDFGYADKAIDMLDLSHTGADSLARYVFSDDAGPYVAPAHEKLLINTLNLINYLETRDLAGARVEARRMSVVDRFLRDQRQEVHPVLSLGGLLAGFAFEHSGEGDEALRYYDDALMVSSARAIRSTIPRLLPRSSFRTERLSRESAEIDAYRAEDADLLIVVGYGRVPHRVASRVPIGLAVARASSALSQADRDKASELRKEALLTWVNYPELAPEASPEPAPVVTIDGQRVLMEDVLDVSAEVRREWQRIEPDVMAAAVSRALARLATGKAVEAAGEATKDSGWKAATAILSVLGRIALIAADTPDTRSWETLPSRVAVARLRLPPGSHRLSLQARGAMREESFALTAGGWRTVSLMALR